MDNKKIVYSFWNYVPGGILDRHAVSDWKELGINVAMSFDYDPLTCKKQEVLDMLDECKRYNMKLIVCDKRTTFSELERVGREKFIEGVQRAVEDFGSHPAIYGFFVGDEPKKEKMSDVTETIKIHLQIAPSLTPFVNFFPYWKTKDFKQTTGFCSGKEYFSALTNVIRETSLSVLSYDHYGQCLESGNIKRGIDTYFLNLNCFRKIASSVGIDFWDSLLSVGHWAYRVPDENDIRWQIYTSLAHGVRGIIWFFIYMRQMHENYRNSPFDSNYRKTELFEIIARQTSVFNDNYAKIFEKIRLTEVYHINKVYGKTKRFNRGRYIKRVTDNKKRHIILSVYEEIENGGTWVSLVNGDQKISDMVCVQYYDGTKKSFWLAPGQMQIFKIEEVQK